MKGYLIAYGLGIASGAGVVLAGWERVKNLLLWTYEQTLGRLVGRLMR